MTTPAKLQKARNSGFSDDQILESLRQDPDLNQRITAATESGFGATEIIDRFIARQERPGVGEIASQASELISGATRKVARAILPESISEPLIEAGEAAEQKVTGRGQAIEETKQAFQTGEIGFPQASPQVIGQLAGGVLDVVGEVGTGMAKSAFRSLPEAAQEQIKGAGAAAGRAFMKTGLGQQGLKALQAGAKDWEAFKQENPQAAKTLSSLGNIGLLAAPVAQKTLGQPARNLARKATVQIAKRRRKFIHDLILPKQTPKVLAEEAARTTEKGLFRTKFAKLTKREAQIARETTKIKTLDAKRSIQYNRTEIGKQVEKLAKSLDSDVAKSGVILPRKNKVEKAINDAIAKLVDENPIIGSDKALTNMANNVNRNAKRILAKHPSTPHGILKARKEFDKWSLGIRKNTFDDTTTNSFKESVKTVRQAMNNIVDDSVPSAAVKEKLRRQSLLFEALDNIDPKAAAEGKNVIVRMYNRLTPVGTERTKIIQGLGTITGVGIIGASALFSPAIAKLLAAGAVVYSGGRLVTSPITKKALSALLKASNKVLATSKDPTLIRQLRADRAIIVDMLKNGVPETQEEINGQ